ncbi:MAG: hypothetical protein KJ574_01400 [Nanoarchaeota archaeon]|nr:hypothetical protein [Nanoarchaeota archaeon]
MERQTPVFVRIEDYKDVLDIMELIKAKIIEAKQIIEQINTLKNQEDSELELWHNELDDVERKIEYMDKTLFEPENI